MRRRWFVVLGLFGFVTLLAGANGLAAHGRNEVEKKAILLAAFGTTVPEAQKALDQVEVRVRQAFPGVEVRWAYTSSVVRSKLAKQGKVLDSPEAALVKLMDERVTHVAVLSLHTIPGEEFHDLSRNAQLFGQMAGGFKKILVAWPLLSSREDRARAAKAMLKHIPPGRAPGEAVLLMGHGSANHPSDAIYAAMNQVFMDLDPNVTVATVDGYPALEDILPGLEAKQVKKAYLMPFMAVAGDHARSDLAGDQPGSWKSILTGKGIACEAVLKGTAEYPEIMDIWMDHLREVFSRLD